MLAIIQNRYAYLNALRDLEVRTDALFRSPTWEGSGGGARVREILHQFAHAGPLLLVRCFYSDVASELLQSTIRPPLLLADRK